MRPITQYACLTAAVLLLACAFTFSLGTYYAQYHFGVGAEFAALAIGRPVALIISALVGFGSFALLRRAGTPPHRAISIAALGVALILGLLFALEWWRTGDGRRYDQQASIPAAPNETLHRTSAARLPCERLARAAPIHHLRA